MKLGDIAPDFTLRDQAGLEFCLSDSLKGKRGAVVFFYPKDNTAMCSREVCGFQNSLGDLTQLDALLVGISSDSVESHQSFANRTKVAFPLLSDEGSQLRKLWRVPNTLGFNSYQRCRCAKSTQ